MRLLMPQVWRGPMLQMKVFGDFGEAKRKMMGGEN